MDNNCFHFVMEVRYKALEFEDEGMIGTSIAI